VRVGHVFSHVVVHMRYLPVCTGAIGWGLRGETWDLCECEVLEKGAYREGDASSPSRSGKDESSAPAFRCVVGPLQSLNVGGAHGRLGRTLPRHPNLADVGLLLIQVMAPLKDSSQAFGGAVP
jgi:hypothetical protein